jgi:hypothetical protein
MRSASELNDTEWFNHETESVKSPKLAAGAVKPKWLFALAATVIAVPCGSVPFGAPQQACKVVNRESGETSLERLLSSVELGAGYLAWRTENAEVKETAEVAALAAGAWNYAENNYFNKGEEVCACAQRGRGVNFFPASMCSGFGAGLEESPPGER